ncbi:FAD-dependent oxidoreductase [Amycolatopsis sp. NPDC001319]|uniref:FAD-dependent oxidoreductase n=1 Tax=unclassified Amycolatopsis TaxID=2618356 RepID=UPI003686FA50
MERVIRTDVAVIGAGVTGAFTAAELARRGVDTVLVGPRDHLPDTDFDVVMTAHAGRTVAGAAPFKAIDSYAVRFGSDSTAEWTTPSLAVYSRQDFERAAADLVGKTDVRRIAGRATSLHGHELHISGDHHGLEKPTVVASHVVRATGWTSRSGAPHGVICSQRFRSPAPDAVSVHLLAPAITDPHDTPLSIRVLPASHTDDQITVTVIATGSRSSTAPQALMDLAVETLTSTRDDSHALVPVGPLVHGEAGISFTAEAVSADSQLIVGDALGLLDPFSWQAYDNAIRTATLAADAIATHLADPNGAARDYQAAVRRTFVGYGEGVRKLARHYHLAWRVLAATATSENPFFRKARTAVLVPGGFTTLAPSTDDDHGPSAATAIYPFLAGCSEVALAAVREQWPFIASIVAAGRSGHRQSMRPALLFGAALSAVGAPPDTKHTNLGAAIELATLGMLALTASPARPTTQRGVNWASASAVLAGDFLLAQAGRLAAGHDNDVDAAFAGWLAELAEHRGTQLEGAANVRGSLPFLASLFEFPARIGAQLGGAPDEVVAAMRRFGRACGKIFAHTEDVRALQDMPTRLDATLRGLLDTRLSALPTVLGEAGLTHERLDADQGLRHRALAASIESCRYQAYAAATACGAIPSAQARSILREFSAALADPVSYAENCTPEKPTSEGKTL